MGRFLIGFAIGAAIGVAVVVLVTPRSGSALRQQITDTIDGAIDAARQASAAHEQALWAEFRAQLDRKAQQDAAAESLAEYDLPTTEHL